MKKKHSEKCKTKPCTCDGYHTFEELYEHRFALFIAAARLQARSEQLVGRAEKTPYVWRSKLHSDGTMFDDWFILGIGYFEGLQITYHLPIEKWEDTSFAKTLHNAPKYDGHTSDDIIKRLKNL